MLAVSVYQEPEDYGEHIGEYRVTVKDDTGRYEKYYTYIPDTEEVKEDFKHNNDFTLIKKDV